MATADFAPVAAGGETLTGTGADDTINLDTTGATGGGAHVINTGGGTDTVVFDGILATGGAAPGIFNPLTANVFTNGSDNFGVSAFEFLTFSNGTVSSGASVTPEQILAASITSQIDVIGSDADDDVPGGVDAPGVTGPVDFDLSTLLDWDGSTATANFGNGGTAIAPTWTIQSVNGQTSNAGANIVLSQGGTNVGVAVVNGTNNGIDVLAENAFHTSITEIGATESIGIDVVLTDGTDTFEETLTVDVIGQASGADNTFAGTDGADTVDGLGGNDTLIGQQGADDLLGDGGDDLLRGGVNDDGVTGTPDDRFAGGAGNDTLFGDGGDDILIGDNDGGGFGPGLSANAAPGDTGDDNIFGGGGNDLIFTGDSVGPAGSTGTDLAFGGTGNDTINGDDGNDVLAGGGNDDTLIGNGGDDELNGGIGIDHLDGGAGNDTLFAAGGDDTLVSGGAGDDLIFNGGGNDTGVDGGTGADTLWGGGGDDVLSGQGGLADGEVDVFAFVVGNGNDTITDFEDGIDQVDLSNVPGVGALADMIVVDDGTDTTVFYGDADSITFLGLTGGAVDDSDFMFA